MYASRVASANPTQGNGLMLDAIACVFLGMTMSEEGEPRVLGTLLGVLLLGLLDNGLTQMNVDSYVREVLVGHDHHSRRRLRQSRDAQAPLIRLRHASGSPAAAADAAGRMRAGPRNGWMEYAAWGKPGGMWGLLFCGIEDRLTRRTRTSVPFPGHAP
jgi:hypothetical protein